MLLGMIDFFKKLFSQQDEKRQKLNIESQPNELLAYEYPKADNKTRYYVLYMVSLNSKEPFKLYAIKNTDAVSISIYGFIHTHTIVDLDEWFNKELVSQLSWSHYDLKQIDREAFLAGIRVGVGKFENVLSII